MFKIPNPIWRTALFCGFLLSLTGCNFLRQLPPAPTQTRSSQETPTTDEFSSRKNSFGDGYIAYTPIEEFKDTSQEEIVNFLVTQWLAHYQTESAATDAGLTDYTVDEIALTEKRSENDPSILAWVRFSILPAQIPNPWASLRGEALNPDDPWWHLEILFGVYEDESGVYWLKIVPTG